MAKSRASTCRILNSLLPPRLAAQLVAHAAAFGDDPADVLADAVALHLEAMEEETAAAIQIDGLLAIPVPMVEHTP